MLSCTEFYENPTNGLAADAASQTDGRRDKQTNGLAADAASQTDGRRDKQTNVVST